MSTYLVDPSGRGTHLTLQSALEQAKRGDTVHVSPGLYAGPVSVPSGVDVVAVPPPGP